jgi:hypothetical protein
MSAIREAVNACRLGNGLAEAWGDAYDQNREVLPVRAGINGRFLRPLAALERLFRDVFFDTELSEVIAGRCVRIQKQLDSLYGRT